MVLICVSFAWFAYRLQKCESFKDRNWSLFPWLVKLIQIYLTSRRYFVSCLHLPTTPCKQKKYFLAIYPGYCFVAIVLLGLMRKLVQKQRLRRNSRIHHEDGFHFTCYEFVVVRLWFQEKWKKKQCCEETDYYKEL